MIKKVAIIGAQGMLGSDLVKYLGKEFSVVAITKDNYKDTIGKNFDVVINANGNSKRFWANQHVFEDFQLSTVSVYKSLFDFYYKTYIYISSSDVYNNHMLPSATKESQLIQSENLCAYGLHKYISECIIRNNTTSYLILRSSMMLGMNMKKGPIYDILQGKPLFVNKQSQIQMITTYEIANILIFFIKHKITNATYNIGGKSVVSFKDIEKLFSLPITFEKDSETQMYNMNVSKLNSIYQLKTSKEYLQHFIGSLKS